MSFKMKTVVMIGITESIFLLLLLWQSLAYLEHSGEEALYRRASETSHLFSLLAKNAVISSDMASLDEITQQIAELEDVRYIRVVDNVGVLAQAGDTKSVQDGFHQDFRIKGVTDGVFDAQASIEESDFEFAKVQVGLSVDSFLMFITKARYRLSGIAIAELIMVGIISLILGEYLTKGLLVLQKVALAVTKGDMSSRVENRTNDELGITAQAFNVMLDKIDDDQRKITENSIRLTQAKQAAEKASQAKSKFLSQMSHEIRSPLNAVLGAVNLVAEKVTEPPEHIQLLKTAQNSGIALLNVVNEILDFSKIEAGYMELRNTEVSVLSLLEDVLNSAETKLNKPELTLIGDISIECMGRVVTDVKRLRQILNILVDNACKFTHKGVVVVSVQRTELTSGDEALQIKVKDTGIGIKKDFLTVIFDEFEQIDTSLEASECGTGLGLNIAQGLINLMNGTIEVTSVFGQGSEFTFTVPVKFEEVRQFSTSTPPGPVVLVSDNQGLQSVFEAKMQQLNVPFLAFAALSALDNPIPPQFFEQSALWLLDHTILDLEPEDSDWLRSLDVTITCIGRLGVVLPASYQSFKRMERPLFLHDIWGLNTTDSANCCADPQMSQQKATDKNSILLVDDIEANRFVAGETLINRGYQVAFARDGKEALEILNTEVFDVILMDIRMPKMNGIDATIQLKSQAGINQHTPVIAMTGNAEISEIQRCKDAGMEGFVCKPFNTDVLIDNINRCIYSSDLASTLKAPPFSVVQQGLPDGQVSVVQPDIVNADNNDFLSIEALNQLITDTTTETVISLIEFFLDDIAQKAPMIKAAQLNADTEEIIEAAHALKSSAGTLGALSMQQLCKSIEQAALANDLAEMTSLSNKFEAVSKQTVQSYIHFSTQLSAH